MKRHTFYLFTIAFIVSIVLTSYVFATTYIVWGTKISIYAQSKGDSTAHMIQLESPMYNEGEHPWCGQRAYISFEDKELFATALAASISGKTVNLIYQDAADSKHVAGHAETTCKVISIWW